MNIKDAEEGIIYRFETDLSQWNNVIFIYHGKGFENDLQVEVLVKNASSISLGMLTVNIDSRLSQRATIVRLGSKDECPEYFL